MPQGTDRLEKISSLIFLAVPSKCISEHLQRQIDDAVLKLFGLERFGDELELLDAHPDGDALLVGVDDSVV